MCQCLWLPISQGLRRCAHQPSIPNELIDNQIGSTTFLPHKQAHSFISYYSIAFSTAIASGTMRYCVYVCWNAACMRAFVRSFCAHQIYSDIGVCFVFFSTCVRVFGTHTTTSNCILPLRACILARCVYNVRCARALEAHLLHSGQCNLAPQSCSIEVTHTLALAHAYTPSVLMESPKRAKKAAFVCVRLLISERYCAD